jgi:putative oxidoreductase
MVNEMARETIGTKLVFPGLGKLYERFGAYSYAFMRLAVGGCLAPHGFSKLFLGTAPVKTMALMGLGPPEFWAYLVGFNEFVMAICLAIGLFTRLAALTIFIEMTVVTFAIQMKFGYFWTSKGFEYPFLIWLICIAIFFRGGGRYSVDHLIGKEL